MSTCPQHSRGWPLSRSPKGTWQQFPHYPIPFALNQCSPPQATAWFHMNLPNKPSTETEAYWPAAMSVLTGFCLIHKPLWSLWSVWTRPSSLMTPDALRKSASQNYKAKPSSVPEGTGRPPRRPQQPEPSFVAFTAQHRQEATGKSKSRCQKAS